MVFLKKKILKCEQGGGPYGSEVTRGQDLTGKDFSGKTLIKQDFKTVLLSIFSHTIGYQALEAHE